MTLLEKIEQMTPTNLLNSALARVPNTVDKRQGSIIYDAIAPFCHELSEMAFLLRDAIIQSNVFSAKGEDLDNIVIGRALTRLQSTRSRKLVTTRDMNGIPMNVAIGTRFSTISNTNPINYVIVDVYNAELGEFVAECEQLGTQGNDYIGELLPISNINGLGSAIMTTLLVPARDIETDEQLLQRYLDSMNETAFGGNVAQYKKWVLEEITGIGAIQVYPVYDGGGTVGIAIVDPNYNPVSTQFIDDVKEQIDPIDFEGLGYGIAPIGHTVSVKTPSIYQVNISAEVELESGYSLIDVEPLIENAINNYLASVNQNWGMESDLNTYTIRMVYNRILASMLSVQGVLNISNMFVNGTTDDYVLNMTYANTEVVKLESLVLA